MKEYIRQPFYDQLWQRLRGRINLIQVVVGARQVGKTTLALQLFDRWPGPKIYETADQPDTPSSEWISQYWRQMRKLCQSKKKKGLLILDEVQKIPNWSEAVKRLFEEDKRTKNNIRVLLLGSSALLMQRGLGESLAGRYELHHHRQWSFRECKECFSLGFEEYIYFGGYPGALLMRKDQKRWSAYMRDSLIESVLSKDILLLTPVSKPVLLRQSFGFSVDHPAEIVSYQKMIGTLHDAGNTTTIASYLQLLSKAFLLVPLERYSGARIRQRGSSPKILILDNGLVNAMRADRFSSVNKNKQLMGRLIENAVGAQLYWIAQQAGGALFYWRQRNQEVDYVLKIGSRLIAIEVKSGVLNKQPAALGVFLKKYKKAQGLIIALEKTASKGSLIKTISLNDFFLGAALF